MIFHQYVDFWAYYKTPFDIHTTYYNLRSWTPIMVGIALYRHWRKRLKQPVASQASNPNIDYYACYVLEETFELSYWASTKCMVSTRDEKET